MVMSRICVMDVEEQYTTKIKDVTGKGQGHIIFSLLFSSSYGVIFNLCYCRRYDPGDREPSTFHIVLYTVIFCGVGELGSKFRQTAQHTLLKGKSVKTK